MADIKNLYIDEDIAESFQTELTDHEEYATKLELTIFEYFISQYRNKLKQKAKDGLVLLQSWKELTNIYSNVVNIRQGIDESNEDEVRTELEQLKEKLNSIRIPESWNEFQNDIKTKIDVLLKFITLENFETIFEEYKDKWKIYEDVDEFYKDFKKLTELDNTCKNLSNDVNEHVKMKANILLSKKYLIPYITVDEKLFKLQNILDKSNTWTGNVENYNGDERTFLHINEMLLRNMEAADLIRADKVPIVYKKKKEALEITETLLDHLSNKFASCTLNLMVGYEDNLRNRMRNFWGDETTYSQFVERIGEHVKKINSLQINEDDTESKRVVMLNKFRDLQNDLTHIKRNLNEVKENIENVLEEFNHVLYNNDEIFLQQFSLRLKNISEKINNIKTVDNEELKKEIIIAMEKISEASNVVNAVKKDLNILEDVKKKIVMYHNKMYSDTNAIFADVENLEKHKHFMNSTTLKNVEIINSKRTKISFDIDELLVLLRKGILTQVRHNFETELKNLTPQIGVENYCNIIRNFARLLNVTFDTRLRSTKDYEEFEKHISQVSNLIQNRLISEKNNIISKGDLLLDKIKTLKVEENFVSIQEELDSLSTIINSFPQFDDEINAELNQILTFLINLVNVSQKVEEMGKSLSKYDTPALEEKIQLLLQYKTSVDELRDKNLTVKKEHVSHDVQCIIDILSIYGKCLVQIQSLRTSEDRQNVTFHQEELRKYLNELNDINSKFNNSIVEDIKSEIINLVRDSFDSVDDE